MPASTKQALPLDGVRVIDMSHLMPGPWCTQVLGDLGADVVKVENARTGDPSRSNPPRFRDESVYFCSVNRNKRSAALDLKDPKDHALMLDLIRTSDVVVESFRPGVASRLGVDYAVAREINPRVIYCAVNGYGSEGSLADTPGHDASIQSLAGLMYVAEDVAAPMPRIQTGDWAAAAYAAIAVLGAYIRRSQTGEGAYIEAPMYDSLMSWSSIALSSSLARMAGFTGEPKLEAFGANPRYAVYQTADRKHVTVCLLEAASWRRFCDHVGRPDLAYDEGPAERHTIHIGRTDAFRNLLTKFCRDRTRDALVAEMQLAGIAISPVLAPDEVLRTPYAIERGITGEIDHPREGRIPFIVDPLARSGLADPHRRPAPALGEHTDEIRNEVRNRVGSR